MPAELGSRVARQEGGLPNECSIALLPLRNLSGDPEDEPLCAGITGDVIHNLTRFRDLTVIAQHSARQIDALTVPPREIARRLGVRYLLVGELQRCKRRLQLQARLIEADPEQVIWSMRFEGPLGDVFAFQDEVAEVVVANLAAEVKAAELRQAIDTAPAKLSAYGLILRGQFLTHRYQPAANLQARLLFERARRADPGYARSYAALSRTFNLDWRYAWCSDPVASLDRALQLAELAVQFDPFDARGHAEVGFALLYRKQHDAALAAYERAIELNPNDADILAEMGDALGHAGQNERALELFNRAISLNPLCPDWYFWTLGGIYFNLRDYRSAIETMDRMTDRSEAHRLLAASYAHLGDLGKARQHAAQLLAIHPVFSIAHWQSVVPDQIEESLDRLIEGLRKAGLK